MKKPPAAVRRIRWRNRIIASYIILTLLGIGISLYMLAHTGLPFFLFRNAGAGAGNLRNLNEGQGPKLTAAARQETSLFLHLFSWGCGLTAAFFAGAVMLGRWKPAFLRVPEKTHAAAAKPAPVAVPVPVGADAPWEKPDFYQKGPSPASAAGLPSSVGAITTVADLRAWSASMEAWIKSWNEDEELSLTT
jgi:hypothetical protein